MSISRDPFARWILEGMSPFGMFRPEFNFPIDVQEKGNEYIVYAPLPGISPQQLSIQAQGNTLRITGDIPEEKPGESGRWLLREGPTGHFERTVTLPANVEAGQAQAEFRNGMLVVELPKEAPGREIPVQAGQQRQQAQLCSQQQGAIGAGAAQPSQQPGMGAESQSGQPQGAMPMGSGQGAGAGEQAGMQGAGGAGQMRAGMTVYGTNGDEIGLVKEVRSNDFLVDRSLRRDVYVPFNAIQTVRNDQVVLNLPADQVDSMNWPNPLRLAERRARPEQDEIKTPRMDVMGHSGRSLLLDDWQPANGFHLAGCLGIVTARR